MKLVDFAFFGQFEEVGFVMCVEIDWDGFVSSISGEEANVEVALSTEFGLVTLSKKWEGEGFRFVDDADGGGFRLFSCDLVKEFDSFAWLLLDVETEGLGSDAEV